MLPVDTFAIHNATPAGTVQNSGCKNIGEGGGEHKILCEAIRDMETLNQSSAKGEGELKISAPTCTRPKCNKVLNLIRFCPKCNKLF